MIARYLAAGLLAGVLFSIPPGPAGVIILNLSLRGAAAQAMQALGAFLAADVLVMVAGLVFLQGVAGGALSLIKPAAGVFLIGFAVMAWRAVGTERGFAATSPFTVFRITLLNPAIWLGALSVLTVASAGPGGGLLPRVLFVIGLEVGGLAWFLAVIFGARRIPEGWRRGLERAAVLGIGLTGVYFASALLRLPAAS